MINRSKKKVLVTGANGAVGSDLIPALTSYGYTVLATDIDCPADNPFPIEYMDIRDQKNIKKTFNSFNPDFVVHLAAEVDVEYCELNPQHAEETNAKGTKNIVDICKNKNIVLLYMSSIGVFDGTKKSLYNEHDKPNPINVYGKTKYRGEVAIQKELKKYFIFRAGWMIGGFDKDKKFVVKILKLIKKGVKKIDVVFDKAGTPTYTPDLSAAIAKILETDNYGIYHVVGKGNPTRYEVAKEIIKLTKRNDIQINRVKSDVIKKVYFAPRPANETADSGKINVLFPGITKDWHFALSDYLSNSFGFDIIGNNPKFSIVICLYVINNRFLNDLKKFKKISYENFELIIVSDKNLEIPKLNFPVRLVLTGKEMTGVGEKRDVGLRAAKGDFIAYIDDDAYPDPKWLSNALLDFNHPIVGAVGGPNITPKEDGFWAKIGGFIYESYLTSGGAQHRFIPKEKMTVRELQGVNLIIRTSLLRKIGGFSTKLFSGDDTKVCYSIRLLGYEVLYDPRVKVYHHRKEFPIKHLKQIRTMATHRGYFVKKYPETSQQVIYFLPSFFTVMFIFGIVLSLVIPNFWILFIFSLLFFLFIGFVSMYKRARLKNAALTSLGILLTHLTYGLFFLKGLLLVKKL